MIPRRETPSALQLSSVTPTLCGSQIFYPEVALCPTQAASSNPSGYSNVCHALALVEGLRWAATAPRYAALHCAALYCAALHCSALHCTVLCCTTLYNTTLYCAALYCTVQHPLPRLLQSAKMLVPFPVQYAPHRHIGSLYFPSLFVSFFLKYAYAVDNEKDIAVYPLCCAAACNL